MTLGAWVVFDGLRIAAPLAPRLSVALDWLPFASYLSIAVTLAVTRVKYLRGTSVGSMVVALALCIIVCGLPYLIHAVAVWSPPVWPVAEAKLMASAAAFSVAAALPFLVPRLGALLTAARSSRLNEQRFVAASNNSSEVFFIL